MEQQTGSLPICYSYGDLERWIQAQYHIIGSDENGMFIGQKKFKLRLIAQYQSIFEGKVPETEIRTIVNRQPYCLKLSKEAKAKLPQTAATIHPSEPWSTLNTNDSGNDTSIGKPSETDQYHLLDDEIPLLVFDEVADFSQAILLVQPPGQAGKVLASPHPGLKELRDFAEVALDRDQNQRGDIKHLFTPDAQRYLLGSDDEDDEEKVMYKNDFDKAVLFSADLLKAYSPNCIPQHGLLGKMSLSSSKSEIDSRIFHNTNVPFSIFIGGSQRSGKSHTLSCLLENYLIQGPVGSKKRQSSALVFHYGEYTSQLSFRPCEVAYLAYPSRQFPRHLTVNSVNVLVAPSNYHNLKALYEQIPGVSVQPLRLKAQSLNTSAILSLMLVDQSESTASYSQITRITDILRELASTSSEGFSYVEFKNRLQACSHLRLRQWSFWQRLEILESFLVLDDSVHDYDFQDGDLAIIDLSCPFVEPNMACLIFDMATNVYVGSRPDTSKIVVVDEAHKYMTNTPCSNALTESLLSVIRQQRHFGARVIISTQEPTQSARLIDVCSMTIFHRLRGSEWFSVLRNHFSLDEEKDDDSFELSRRIRNLRLGEALISAPSALLGRPKKGGFPEKLGTDLIQIKVRKKVTWDVAGDPSGWMP